jgi:hypothetical protein
VAAVVQQFMTQLKGAVSEQAKIFAITKILLDLWGPVYGKAVVPHK